MHSPWYKTTYTVRAFGHSMPLQVPFDVFSTQRIDEGTELLHAHLPSSTPLKILDMGCGYGALSLPIAAQFPNAELHMVDRDLVAVEWAKENLKLNSAEFSLNHVLVYGSVGFNQVQKPSEKSSEVIKPFDWILCNVPARIGTAFISYLFTTGVQVLSERGEIRVVVINDLCETIQEIKLKENLPIEEVVKGSRHTVFALKKPQKVSGTGETQATREALYLRDVVEVQDPVSGPITLQRPFDFGGDDPKRLNQGLPALLDVLPKSMGLKKNVLCFRPGYGAVPLILKKRFPDLKITVIDRDLLGLDFILANSEAHHMALNKFIPSYFFPAELNGHEEQFDFILGELSPSAGEAVAKAECESILSLLSKNPKVNAEALLLVLKKLDKEWLQKWKLKARMQTVLVRGDYAVVRLSL